VRRACRAGGGGLARTPSPEGVAPTRRRPFLTAQRCSLVRTRRCFRAAVGASAERLEVHDNPTLRKERGAFFTPARISSFLVEWAVRGSADRVLEPSCGEASFLLPAATRLRSLGASCAQQLHGVDMHAASVAKARKLVEGAGFPVNVRCSDFFDVEPDPTFDVVVGNPPYIRYQQFAGDDRAKSLRAALAAGVRLTRLASSWAAFTVHASRFLKPGGRLGLVLPAELLTVNYAAPVRRFLLKNFAKVRLVMFEELVFPGVLEEVVLLMAEGFGSAQHFEVFQATDLDDLRTIKGKDWSGFTPEGGGKWTGALLPGDAFSVYRSVVESPSFSTLLDWGETPGDRGGDEGAARRADGEGRGGVRPRVGAGPPPPLLRRLG